MGVFSIIAHGGSFAAVLMYTLAILIISIFVLPMHEFAHGYVAYKLGDNTAKYNGRLTLNPLAHIDPFGSLALFLVGFGWAKPVPVNPMYFKNPKRGMAITALAGPLSNFLAAILGGFLLQIAFKLGWEYACIFLEFYIQVNIVLSVFNLIPIPPLDGSKILMRFIPDSIAYKLSRYENYFYIFLVVLLFMGVLDTPLAYLENKMLYFILQITALPF